MRRERHRSMRRRARLLRVERSGGNPSGWRAGASLTRISNCVRRAEERERQVEREQLLLILQGHGLPGGTPPAGRGHPHWDGGNKTCCRSARAASARRSTSSKLGCASSPSIVQQAMPLVDIGKNAGAFPTA